MGLTHFFDACEDLIISRVMRGFFEPLSAHVATGNVDLFLHKIASSNEIMLDRLAAFQCLRRCF